MAVLDLEITFKEIVKVNIGPGDILAIQCDQYLRNDQREQLVKSVEYFMARYGRECPPIMVLDKGLSLTVVHREEVP